MAYNIVEELTMSQELVDKGLTEESIKKNYQIVDQLYQQPSLLEKEVKKDFYLFFAFLLFDEKKYSEFLKMVCLAQKNGTIHDDILESLENTFIEPNKKVFKENYEYNKKGLEAHGTEYFFTEWENIKYILIPTEIEETLYIYDKRNREIVSEVQYVQAEQLQGPILRDNYFSDFIIKRESELLWRYLNNSSMNDNKIYFLPEDKDLFLVFLQGKKWDSDILKKLKVFGTLSNLTDYLQKNDSYLPWNIVAYTKDEQKIKDELWLLHNQRICHKQKDFSKILLSVCIPSYNRGHLAYANMLQLLKLPYDHEIEFILSNNGTKNETAPYYEKIKGIKDSRFLYHEFDENQGVSINACKACELSRGRFMMLLSDEDSLYEESLGKILDIIYNKGDDLSVIKTVHKVQGNPGQGYVKKGIEAYSKFSFVSHYLSTNIFNNKYIKDQKMTQYTRDHLDNPVCYLYPHSSWDMHIMEYGDVFGMSIILVDEDGARGDLTEVDHFVENVENKRIPEYQTIEGRLKQHQGNIAIMKDIPYIMEHFHLFRHLIKRLSLKTKHLVELSNHVHYEPVEYDQNLEKSKGFLLKMLEENHGLYLENDGEEYYREDYNFIKKIHEG